MKYLKYTILTLIILIQTSFAHSDKKQLKDTLSDREEINQVMITFFKWDTEGGVVSAENSLSKTALYHFVNDKGQHETFPADFDFKGKGKDAPEHDIVDIDIYDNMAVVTVLLRYKKNTYMKTFILYKLLQGWRITNLAWGSLKNTQ